MDNNHYNLIKSTFEGKKVFLTGHTGFKGSWLLVLLEILGAEVKGYALAPEPHHLYSRINGDEICKSVISDVRDYDALKSELVSFQPDFVFHMAAQPLVRRSYDEPLETLQTNVQGTANLLDACRYISGNCVMLIITTDKVYQNNEWEYAYREVDRLGGKDPYSMSKAACELLVSSYEHSFFNRDQFSEHGKSISSVRAGNVIGGGDWAEDRIIPDIVRAIHNNVPLSVRNGNSVRPWQHVLEPLGGYLLLATQMHNHGPDYNGAWNFGPDATERFTVMQLVNHIARKYPKLEIVDSSNEVSQHEAGLLKLDISKAIANLHWLPQLTCVESIDLTMDWYDKVNNGADELELTVGQVNKYLNS